MKEIVYESTNRCMIRNPATGKVLVLERVKNWKGYTFPGGKVEKKESILASVIREVKEETGLEVSQLSFSGIKKWYDEKSDFRYLVFLYQTETFTGCLLEGTDGGRLSWMNLDELTDKNWLPVFPLHWTCLQKLRKWSIIFTMTLLLLKSITTFFSFTDIMGALNIRELWLKRMKGRQTMDRLLICVIVFQKSKGDHFYE